MREKKIKKNEFCTFHLTTTNLKESKAHDDDIVHLRDFIPPPVNQNFPSSICTAFYFSLSLNYYYSEFFFQFFFPFFFKLNHFVWVPATHTHTHMQPQLLPANTYERKGDILYNIHNVCNMLRKFQRKKTNMRACTYNNDGHDSIGRSWTFFLSNFFLNFSSCMHGVWMMQCWSTNSI